MRESFLDGLLRDDTHTNIHPTNQVAALADQQRAARAFTDAATCALQCLVCGAGLRGNADAEAHAAQTGHQNFAQTGN